MADSFKTRDVLAFLGFAVIAWLCYSWTSHKEWQATRDGAIKVHQGERITADTLHEIDEETSRIFQDSHDWESAENR